MTTEIEKTFFETFGIKPKKGCTAYDKFTEEEADTICNDKCAECLYLDDVYPKITDRILLELMELLMKQQATEFYYHNDEYLFSSKLLGSNRPTCNRVKNLRELVLRTATCLDGFAPLKDKMLKQVRILFEEG